MLQFHKPLPSNQTEIYNSIKNYRCNFSSKNVKNQIFIATVKFKFPALFSRFFFFLEFRNISGIFSNMTPETLAYKFMKIFAHPFHGLRDGKATPFGFIELAASHYTKPEEESATPIHMQMCVQTESIFTAINFGSTFCGGKVERAPDFTALR